MKKIVSGAMALCLVASMTACSTRTPAETTAAATEAAKQYVAGTYSASEEGFAGKVTVTITTSESEITDVKVEGPNETPDKGGAAMEQLQGELLKAQSAEVDAVSGSTVTSDAVKKAMAAAIEKAKSGDTSTGSDDALAFTAGTYTGTGVGYNGPTTVEVTFDDSKITDIKILDTKETGHVGDTAFEVLIPQMIEANGTGVDAVSGATFSSKALKTAVNDAAEQAGATNLDAFKANTLEVKAQDPIEDTWDVVVVGGGGAGMAAAAQAAQNGESVLVIEKNVEVGGNTLVSGGQYQSVMPYLVWDAENPDATTGIGFDGNEYNKVKSVQGCIDELKTIYNWSEEPFDEDYYDTHEYVAGDIEELSKHGVVAEYLPTLQALKKEIKAYLDWAQPKLDAGTPESDLTLFSTVNLHIFQSYYGGLRQSADKSSWIWGDVDLVSQFIKDGQDLKPWLESMGSTFVEDTQPTLIGALWYRENQFIGANVDTDGDGQTEEYAGRWGTYFVAPMTSFLNANEHNQIMTRTTAEELIQEDGRVTGVKATMYDGTPVTAHAKKGVVLATGGYAANIAKVVETNKYWDPEYLNDKTETTNRSSLQGDGITMAEAVGAATTGMGYTQLMPISWVDNGDLAFGGGDYAVYINPTTGKRFVDETSERDVLSLGEFRNGIEWNGHKGVFIEIANAATPIPGPYPYKDEDVEGRQYVRTIGEIADVLKAEGFDTDVETIKATIEDYDQAIINGTQPQDVSKKQFSALIGDCEKNEDGSYKADTYNLDDAKLRIRFLAPSTHHTMGGISVDVKRHVLDADGKAIDGLYAAGEVTGGIHGGNRLGGNAITEIFVSGRTAANAISEDN